MDAEEIQKENRKIRYLRLLVDFSVLSIQQGDVSHGEALKLVEDALKVKPNSDGRMLLDAIRERMKGE